jgi:hypothetical protein
MDAKNKPVTRKYDRKEVHTSDMPITHKEDIDLDAPISHGESLVHIAGESLPNQDYLDELAFMEEPVTVLIEENSRSDFPETHVACQVNGKEAEVFANGHWMAIGWLPIGVPLVTKRKYVEVLARSRSDSIKTVHDDATVERPRNTLTRRSSYNYPLSVLEDVNPRGRQWLSNIMARHA